MRKNLLLAVSFLTAICTMALASYAQATTGKEVARALVRSATASIAGSAYSMYSMSAKTTNGGRVDCLFIWQRSIDWNLKGLPGPLIIDTQPILSMAKYNASGNLETAITYVPLFLIQYNDSDGNGLFDLWTRSHREFNDEVGDNDIEWERLKDRPYRIYPLAPMFHMMFHQSQWEWNVSPLVNKTVVVNNTQVEEFSWNISATVTSIPWLHTEVIEEKENLYRRGLEWTTIDVTLGYHVRFLPENPEVKYDLDFANTNWADAVKLRLALISTVIYRSGEPVVVKIGSRGFRGFNQTIEAREPLILVSEKAIDSAKAFVSYTPEAVVDDRNIPDAVRTAIHPMFMIPTPVVLPEGLYVKGIIGEIEGRLTRNYIAFAHQVSVPRFENSLSHDPTITLAAQLSTVTLSRLPSDLITVRVLVAAGATAIVVTTAYILALRRKRVAIIVGDV